MGSSRRFEVPFDPEYFTRRAKSERPLPPDAAFRHILETNHWTGESASGGGSNLEQTAGLRQALPDLCRRLSVRTILDLPCGHGRVLRYLRAAFPEAPPYGSPDIDLEPHLTIASDDPTHFDDVESASADHLPFRRLVKEATLIVEGPQGRWRTEHRFPLG